MEGMSYRKGIRHTEKQNKKAEKKSFLIRNNKLQVD